MEPRLSVIHFVHAYVLVLWLAMAVFITVVGVLVLVLMQVCILGWISPVNPLLVVCFENKNRNHSIN